MLKKLQKYPFFGRSQLWISFFIIIQISILGSVFMYQFSVRNYEELDLQNIKDAAVRVNRTLHEQFNVLGSKISDWSKWTPALEYIRKPNKFFEDENLYGTVLNDLNLDRMIFLNEKLEVVGYFKNEDGITLKVIEKPKYRFLQKSHPMMDLSKGENTAKGFGMLGESPVMIVASSITDSTGRIPRNGRLLFIKNLDTSFVANLEEQTMLKISLISQREANSILSRSEFISFDLGKIHLIKDYAFAYVRLENLFKEEVGAIKIEIPRKVMILGRDYSLRLALIGSVFGSLVFMALAYIFHLVSGKRALEGRLDLLQKVAEAQSVAKLGSWDFYPQSGDFIWSEECFKIFEFVPRDTPREKILSLFLTAFSQKQRSELENLFNKSELHASEEEYKIALEFHASIKDSSISSKALKYVEMIVQVQDAKLRGTFQDVTERRLVENQLANERSKLAQASKLASLGEMSAGIAHEINNPLAIISASLVSLEKDAKDNSLNSEAKFLRIHKAIDRISKIVRGLKKFSRSGGKNERNIVDLSAICAEAMTLAEITAHRLNVELRREFSENLWIEADELEIEQVIINLLNNAMDASKSSTNPWVFIKAYEQESRIFLEVWDSGIGVSRDLKDKIFDPFFTTKSVGQGTGLGLSIVKGILVDHKAEIAVLDTKNTCFQVVFDKALKQKKLA